MIEARRAAFNDPQMAFGIISLCTAGNQTADNYLEQMLDVGANIREARYKTFLDLRKAGVQTTRLGSLLRRIRFSAFRYST